MALQTVTSTVDELAGQIASVVAELRAASRRRRRAHPTIPRSHALEQPKPAGQLLRLRSAGHYVRLDLRPTTQRVREIVP